MEVNNSTFLRNRPFLKWAGGKYRLLPEILPLISAQIKSNKKVNTLIEPFVGAGSVFLNSDFDNYILADINPDLINLFNQIKSHSSQYLVAARQLFEANNANSAEFYYDIRMKFNQSEDPFWRSVYFLYLNRFGYNGLCRYNRKHKYNVPFGRYIKIYFPEKEILLFAEKAQKAQFICADFSEIFSLVDKNCIVYCDPPYAPFDGGYINFTSYSSANFGLSEQQKLASLAQQTSDKAMVIVSNHDTTFTRNIYQKAEIISTLVPRMIGRSGDSRKKVAELIAIFK